MPRQIPYTRTIRPFPGFETFAVTYNVWASQEDVEALYTDSIGEPATKDRSGVIMDMTGWPEMNPRRAILEEGAVSSVRLGMPRWDAQGVLGYATNQT